MHNNKAEINPVLNPTIEPFVTVILFCIELHNSTNTKRNPADSKSGPRKNNSRLFILILSLILETLIIIPNITVKIGTKKNFAKEEPKN